MTVILSGDAQFQVVDSDKLVNRKSERGRKRKRAGPYSLARSRLALLPLTVFRINPFASAIYYTREFLVFSLVAGVFICLFKGFPTDLELLGVDALGFIFNKAAANLGHAQVRLPCGPLEGVFVGPTQHQIHHNIDYQDVTFGSCFAVWVKWLGTLVHSQELTDDAKWTFGLSEPRDAGATLSAVNQHRLTLRVLVESEVILPHQFVEKIACAVCVTQTPCESENQGEENAQRSLLHVHQSVSQLSRPSLRPVILLE